MKNLESFKSSLEQEYSFPSNYTFKFIIATEFKDAVLNLLPTANKKEKLSRNGKYTSVSLTHFMKSSSEIVYIYEKATKIKGVISL